MDERAVGWNDRAGGGVDWFAVDELIGDFSSPGVHPVFVDVCVSIEQHRIECNM